MCVFVLGSRKILNRLCHMISLEEEGKTLILPLTCCSVFSTCFQILDYIPSKGSGVGVLPSVPRRFISNLCVPLMCIIFWSIHIVFANIYLTLLPAAGVVKGTLDDLQLSWPGPVIALLVPRWYTRSLFVFVTSIDLYKCMFKKRGTKGSRSERKQWCT